MAVSILSVSYDPALLMTRQLMLEQAGYSVTSAIGFTQAETQCRNGKFDLMVLGHSIPASDKQALIHFFRSHCSAPVVSLLRAGERLVDEADYHVSPDEPRMLLREITSIVPPVGEQRAS